MPYLDGLPVASAVSSTDIIAIDQGGIAGRPGTSTTRQATLAQLFIGGGGAFLPLIGGTVTGLTTFSGGGTGLAVSNNATVGGTLTAAGAGTGLAVTNDQTVGGTVTAGKLQTADNTYTFSGSTQPLILFGRANMTGVSTNSTPAMAIISNSRAAVDASSLGSAGYHVLNVTANIGDSGIFTGTAGGQGAIYASINQNGPVNSKGATVFMGVANFWYVGAAAITGGDFGNGFAINPQVILTNAASGYSLATVVEGVVQSDMPVNTLAIRSFASAFSGGSNLAPVSDYAYGIFRNPNEVGFRNGLVFSRHQAPFGVDSAGSLISAPVQVNGGGANGWINQVAAFGVNLPTVNFGTAAWWTPGFQLLAEGTHRIGTGTVGPVTAGLSIDVGDYSGGSPTVSVAGLGYVVNDQITDTNGGVLNVDTVNGSGAITALRYLRTPHSYGGAGAATMALKGGSGNQAAVVGVTWTQRTELDVGLTNARTIKIGNSSSDTILAGSFDLTTMRTATTLTVLDSGNAAAFQFVTPGGGNSVAHIATTSVTSGAPTLSAEGAASNIDFVVVPKGTGQFNISGTAATTAAVPASFSANRYLAIKINGTSYYLPAATSTW